MGLLRTLLIIVLVFYAFRFITRFVLPFIMKYFIGKVQRDLYNIHHGDVKDAQRKKGEVRIDHAPEKESSKRNNDGQGEYIDFEEVE